MGLAVSVAYLSNGFPVAMVGSAHNGLGSGGFASRTSSRTRGVVRGYLSLGACPVLLLKTQATNSSTIAAFPSPIDIDGVRAPDGLDVTVVAALVIGAAHGVRSGPLTSA